MTSEIPESLPVTSVESPKQLLRSSLESLKWTAIFLVILLLITGIIVSIYGFVYLRTFSTAAGTTYDQVISTAKQALSSEPTSINSGYKTLLILGTDELENRPDAAILTDTIILATLNLNNGNVKLLSLPRDLWDDKYKTRINAYYYYGLDRDNESPENFSTQAVSELTNIEFDHTFVISLKHLAELVDILGGVEIDVQEGFTDTQFPRTDVDVSVVTDPELLYETISFSSGKQIMDSATALKYVRSRKSEGDQGTDNARSIRQQQLIQSILAKILTPEVIFSPQTSGQLYGWYLANLNNSWPVVDLVATARSIYPAIRNIRIQSNQVSISDGEKIGAIYHPPQEEYQGQWVYAIQDFSLFSTEIKQKLFTD